MKKLVNIKKRLSKIKLKTLKSIIIVFLILCVTIIPLVIFIDNNRNTSQNIKSPKQESKCEIESNFEYLIGDTITINDVFDSTFNIKFINETIYKYLIFKEDFKVQNAHITDSLVFNICRFDAHVKFKSIDFYKAVKSNKTCFLSTVGFLDSRVGDITSFIDTEFDDLLEFRCDTFYDKVTFKNTIARKFEIEKSAFKKSVSFQNCNFGKANLQKLNITESKFHGQLNFVGKSILISPVFQDNDFDSIVKVKFEEITLIKPLFQKNNFYGEVDFSDSVHLEYPRFRNTTFYSPVTFSNMVFDSIADFSDSVVFLSTITFENVKFNDAVNFSNIRFDSTVSFINCGFSSKVDFTGAHLDSLYFKYRDLPDTLIFKNIVINKKVSMEKYLEHTDTILALNKCNINLTNTCVEKFSFFYNDFRLLFDPNDAMHKHRIYNNLLKVYKDQGMIYCHEILNKEYQKYCLEHDKYNGDNHPLNHFPFLQTPFGWLLNKLHSYWWGYAYEKERILIWTLYFLFIFSYINIFFGKYIFSQIYKIKKEEIITNGEDHSMIMHLLKLLNKKFKLKNKYIDNRSGNFVNQKLLRLLRLGEKLYLYIPFLILLILLLVYILGIDVLIWIPISLFIFSIIIFSIFFYLTRKFPSIKKYFNSKYIKKGFLLPSLAFHYTARLFFTYHLDFEKIKYEENIKSFKGALGLLFVLIIHLTGLMCLVFIANYILIGGF